MYVYVCIYIFITRRRSYSFAEYWKHLWHVSTMFTHPAITPPEVNRFGWNLGHSEYIVWSWPWQILRDPCRSESKRASQNFVFFCEVNNARLYRLPVSQISGNLHTRRGSERCWILSERIFENLFVRGRFFQKGKFFDQIANEFRLQTAMTP